MTKDECEIETSKAIMEMRSRIAELEQENATLKKDKERLTKAKKVIGNLYAICKDNHYPNTSVLMEQAEQFLKEAESTETSIPFIENPVVNTAKLKSFLKEVEAIDIREDSTLDGDWVVDEH